MHVPVPSNLSPLRARYLLFVCHLYLVHYTVFFFFFFIDDSPTLSDSTLGTRASETGSDRMGFLRGIDWCGLFSYVEQSPTFFHCL